MPMPPNSLGQLLLCPVEEAMSAHPAQRQYLNVAGEEELLLLLLLQEEAAVDLPRARRSELRRQKKDCDSSTEMGG